MNRHQGLEFALAFFSQHRKHIFLTSIGFLAALTACRAGVQSSTQADGTTNRGTPRGLLFAQNIEPDTENTGKWKVTCIGDQKSSNQPYEETNVTQQEVEKNQVCFPKQTTTQPVTTNTKVTIKISKTSIIQNATNATDTSANLCKLALPTDLDMEFQKPVGGEFCLTLAKLIPIRLSDITSKCPNFTTSNGAVWIKLTDILTPQAKTDITSATSTACTTTTNPNNPVVPNPVNPNSQGIVFKAQTVILKMNADSSANLTADQKCTTNLNLQTKTLPVTESPVRVGNHFKFRVASTLVGTVIRSPCTLASTNQELFAWDQDIDLNASGLQ